jgi:hypothetical protein
MYILVFVALSSALLYVVGRLRGWRPAALGAAAARLLECVGLAVVLFALNVAVAVLTILVVRAATGRFVSLYLATDFTLALLAFVQAVLVQWWRALGAPSGE